MAGIGPQVHEHQSTEEGPESKRRRVRKGTQSCWECKRRKVRCIFAAPTDTVCNGCKRRGASCIRQEFSDEPRPTASNRELADRLGRVEALVGQLVRNPDVNGVSADISDVLARGMQDTCAEPRSSTSQDPCRNMSIPTPGHTNVGYATSLNSPGQWSMHNVGTDALPAPQPPPRSCSSVRIPTPGEGTQLGVKLGEVSRKLLAAWPSRHDLDLILSIPVGGASLYHGVICRPYSDLLSEDMPSPHDILQTPRAGTHPVLIARKLLILGTYMQGIRPCFAKDLEGMTTNYRDVMSGVVETAASLVTSSDELIDTLEGIECIMMESMYRNNAGNLRRGYLAMRRAMVIAQMMGLHLRNNPRQPKVLDPETRMRISPEHMWFRLVQSDRYFSMMLGLPQGSLESRFANPEALKSCTPLERMERIDCAASGRIIQRNHTEMHGLAATRDIDKQLQKAAASMPPQWWLMPDLTTSVGSDTDTLRETIRFMDQLAHYSLLEQLHLPYLLHPSVDRRYRYSKMAAVTASRELLSRFVAFRTIQPDGCYCRGVDFLAFIASTTLCLAHIEAHRQRHIRENDSEEDADFTFLAHQRLGDCGLMERTLESMDYMVQANNDVIASKIASILRHLLAIEADAANSGSYTANASEGGDTELGCSGSVSEGGNVLHIYIPYLGAVKIERCGVSKSVQEVPSPRGDEFPCSSTLVASASDPAVSFGPLQPHQRQREQANHSLVSTDSPAGYHLGCQSSNPDWQAVPSHFDHSAHDSEELLGSEPDGSLDPHLLVPALTLDADDWALQGVDFALFDNIIRGSEVLDERWAE